MISGTLSEHSLPTLLRSLSQKRRSGVLDISEEEGQLQIFFHNGKIVGASHSAQPLTLSILEQLKLTVDSNHPAAATLTQLGCLPELSLEELYNTLVPEGLLSHDSFLVAKHRCEYQLLHSLKQLAEAPYQFRLEYIDFELSLALSLSAAQLLLELSEISAADSAGAVRGLSESQSAVVESRGANVEDLQEYSSEVGADTLEDLDIPETESDPQVGNTGSVAKVLFVTGLMLGVYQLSIFSSALYAYSSSAATIRASR